MCNQRDNERIISEALIKWSDVDLSEEYALEQENFLTLLGQVKRVRELHVRESDEGCGDACCSNLPDYCGGCGYDYPCPTIRALNGE